MLAEHSTFDSIIIQLADGDAEKIRMYRQDYTHSEIVTAWKSRLINA